MRHVGIFALAGLTALLLSSELALSLPIRGVGPDLLVMVVLAYAMGVQPRTAAVAGFAAGLFRDLLLTTPAGLSAFAYAVVAYPVALVGSVRAVSALVGMVAGATFVSQALFGVGTLLVAQQVNSGPLPRVIVLTTVYNAMLAPLIMPLLRRVTPAEQAGASAGASKEA